MELYYNNEVLQKNIWINSNEISNLEITWDYKNNKYYTLIIYDLDTPSIFIHLLVTNIPRNEIEYGTVILNYMKPNPPSNTHRYIIAVFEQAGLITESEFGMRDRFPLRNFLLTNNLRPLDEKMIISSRNEFYLVDRNAKNNNPKNNIIQEDSDLNERSQKYCSCVIDVASKNIKRCNLERNWGNVSGEKTCYSPYAVCAKSVGTTNRECGLNYNYNIMTKEQLITFLNLNRIDADISLNKDQLMKLIQSKKL